MTQRSETDVEASKLERRAASEGIAAKSQPQDREYALSASSGASPTGRRPPTQDEYEAISLIALAGVVLKRWKLALGLPLLAGALAAIISMIIPAKYTATASFVPEAEPEGVSLPGGLSTLASQFGILTSTSGSNSPRFYAEVLESRTLRDQVLLSAFLDPRTAAAEDSATLLDILGIGGETETARLEAGREELSRTLAVDVSSETGVVALSVETRYAGLSADLANRLVELLNRFNLETRQSSAQERRRFIEDRVRNAQEELRLAEEDLESFLESNRQYAGSPELTFQYERLQRQVTIKEEVVITLVRQYEQARVQQVNDTPVITVIDRAVPPERRSSPKRKLSVALALVGGGVLGLVGAFGAEFLERAGAENADELREFSSYWGSMKQEVSAMIGRFRRRKR